MECSVTDSIESSISAVVIFLLSPVSFTVSNHLSGRLHLRGLIGSSFCCGGNLSGDPTSHSLKIERGPLCRLPVAISEGFSHPSSRLYITHSGK